MNVKATLVCERNESASSAHGHTDECYVRYRDGFVEDHLLRHLPIYINGPLWRCLCTATGDSQPGFGADGWRKHVGLSIGHPASVYSGTPSIDVRQRFERWLNTLDDPTGIEDSEDVWLRKADVLAAFERALSSQPTPTEGGPQ